MQVVLGVMSGIMGGLFGMQGPPAVLYFLAVAESKERYAALAAKDYYESNKEKFDFIKYSIIDNETGEDFVL